MKIPRLAPRRALRAALAALILWLAVWLGWLTAARSLERLTWLALALPPLLLVLPWALRGTAGALAWCGFLALGYFAQGVTVMLVSAGDARFGAVEAVLSLALFVAAAGALRSVRRDLSRAGPAPP